MERESEGRGNVGPVRAPDHGLPAGPGQDGLTAADVSLGLAPRPAGEGVLAQLSLAEIGALALSLLWLIIAAVVFLILPSGGADGLDPGRALLNALGVVLPIALIWVAALAMRSARIVREEAARLQVALDAIRHAYLTERQARGVGVVPGPAAGAGLQDPPSPGVPHGAKATAGPPQRAAREAASQPTRPRTQPRPDPRPDPRPAPPPRGPADVPVRAAPADSQPGLALGSPEAEYEPLERGALIRALNFPDTDQDKAGFAALRLALRDRRARQLIQASQDVLTLLSQDGIYMDDLVPDRARPEVWRRFAQGERGRVVAALGGVRDRNCLALVAVRMREDTIFRDAAHHFLRLFDRMLASFEPEASDADLAALAETRTARSFMLLGRVSGTFD